MKLVFEKNTIYDPKYLAKMLEITPRCVRQMINREELPRPIRKIGRNRFWTGQELYSYIMKPKGAYSRSPGDIKKVAVEQKPL